MVKRLAFSAEDHVRIARAITEAEAKTSGEIFAVRTKASDDYIAPSAVVALAVPLAASVLAAFAGTVLGIDIAALPLVLAQAAGTFLLLLATRLSLRLRLALAPFSVKASRAHRTALAQFLAHGIHQTEARTGVLLFVSEAEHYAEIVADDGIDAKVPQAEWDAIVALLVEAAKQDRLADGFIAGIDHAGTLLATHFPKGAGDKNEIADRLVEI